MVATEQTRTTNPDGSVTVKTSIVTPTGGSTTSSGPGAGAQVNNNEIVAYTMEGKPVTRLEAYGIRSMSGESYRDSSGNRVIIGQGQFRKFATPAQVAEYLSNKKTSDLQTAIKMKEEQVAKLDRGQKFNRTLGELEAARQYEATQGAQKFAVSESRKFNAGSSGLASQDKSSREYYLTHQSEYSISPEEEQRLLDLASRVDLQETLYASLGEGGVGFINNPPPEILARSKNGAQYQRVKRDIELIKSGKVELGAGDIYGVTGDYPELFTQEAGESLIALPAIEQKIGKGSKLTQLAEEPFARDLALRKAGYTYVEKMGPPQMEWQTVPTTTPTSAPKDAQVEGTYRSFLAGVPIILTPEGAKPAITQFSEGMDTMFRARSMELESKGGTGLFLSGLAEVGYYGAVSPLIKGGAAYAGAFADFYALGALGPKTFSGKLTPIEEYQRKQIMTKELPAYAGETAYSLGIAASYIVGPKLVATIGGKVAQVVAPVAAKVPFVNKGAQYAVSLSSKFGASEYGKIAAQKAGLITTVGLGALGGFRTTPEGNVEFSVEKAAGVIVGVGALTYAVNKGIEISDKAMRVIKPKLNPFSEKSYVPKEQAEVMEKLGVIGKGEAQAGGAFVKGEIVSAKEQASVLRKQASILERKAYEPRNIFVKEAMVGESKRMIQRASNLESFVTKMSTPTIDKELAIINRKSMISSIVKQSELPSRPLIKTTEELSGGKIQKFLDLDTIDIVTDSGKVDTFGRQIPRTTNIYKGAKIPIGPGRTPKFSELPTPSQWDITTASSKAAKDSLAREAALASEFTDIIEGVPSIGIDSKRILTGAKARSYLNARFSKIQASPEGIEYSKANRILYEADLSSEAKFLKQRAEPQFASIQIPTRVAVVPYQTANTPTRPKNLVTGTSEGTASRKELSTISNLKISPQSIQSTSNFLNIKNLGRNIVREQTSTREQIAVREQIATREQISIRQQTQTQTKTNVLTRAQTLVRPRVLTRTRITQKITTIPPTLIFKFGGPNKTKMRKKKQMGSLTLKSSQKPRSIYADLISVTQSQLQFGKATSPSMIKRPGLFNNQRNLAGFVPTVELLNAKRRMR